jgi:hypothetical protein
MRKTIWRIFGVSLLLLLLGGGWFIYYIVTTSLESEENLHATLFTIRLVDQFVSKRGRWPRSWAELEAMKMRNEPPSSALGETDVIRIGGAHGYDWPAVSAEMQKRVFIDFQADPREMAEQDVMKFEAIRPIGPHYPYRSYGFIESLQLRLRWKVDLRWEK